MARDVEARRLLLPAQPLCLRHFIDVRQLQHARLLNRLVGEEAHLAAHGVLLLLGRFHDGLRQDSEELTALRAERVERAALDEALDDAAVDDTHVDAAAEVRERAEGAALLADARDILDGRLADIAHGGESEADGIPVDAEVGGARIDVWRQDLDAHAAAELDVGRDLRRVHDAREHRRHELRWVVRLEIGRLPGDERVRRTVRLVEAVVGKVRQEVEDRVGKARINVVLLAAIEEVLLLRHQDLVLLLAHCAAQEVGLSEREAREHLHDLHDLLLIEHDAERLLEDGL